MRLPYNKGEFVRKRYCNPDIPLNNISDIHKSFHATWRKINFLTSNSRINAMNANPAAAPIPAPCNFNVGINAELNIIFAIIP